MKHCPTCSSEVSAASRFCGACGAELPGDSRPETETSLQSQPPRTPTRPVSSDAPDGARFLPGTLLAERYRIVGLVGRGGMGEVYRADDLKLAQPVALKFLPEALDRDASRLARLINEVRLARQVSHPNVCRVYDVGDVDGMHFMAMEYVDGEDLSSLLRRIGRLPQEKAIQISRQICAGLAAAHEQGILHRDLKPANVMIDGRGRVKITDFGLAGLASGIEGAEIRSGTPAYMAPEQLAGREVSVRSDLYALGLVLYETFTGKPAFRGRTPGEIARLQQDTMPTSPASIVSGIEEPVERLILRCLEREPRDRPETALAVAAALPGGDPLAAALAAGETPSPQMVAQASVAGALHPAVGAACLVAVLASIAFALFISSRESLYDKVPLDRTPQELASDATRILADLSHGDLPSYRSEGFEANLGYLRWVQDEDPSPSRWDRLGSGRPPGLFFWLRYAPSAMEPADVHGSLVTRSDPPQHEPGSGTIRLDTNGRLESLAVVPPPSLEEGAPREPVDWSVLFDRAGLEFETFRETPPIRTPGAPCDELRAWTGTAYGDDIETTVQAGALAGRTTYFEILAPWRDETGFPEPGRVLNVLFGILVAAVVIGAVLLARRNVLLGRSDRKGAFRLALFFVTTMLLSWLLVDVQLRTFEIGRIFQNLVFGRALAHALLHALLAWVFYIALEPYVRRLWPESLVSWARLLVGRWRDPLVGRDVLIGMAAMATFWVCAGAIRIAAFKWTDTPSPMPDLAGVFNGSLGSFRNTLAMLFNDAQGAVYVPMAFVVLVLLLRMVLRRTDLAIGTVVLLFGAVALLQPLPDGSPGFLRVLSAAFGLLLSGTLLTLLFRFGLLSVMGGFFVMIVQNSPLTADLSRWYAGSSLLVVFALVAIAGGAFYVSLGGRKLFADSLLEG